MSDTWEQHAAHIRVQDAERKSAEEMVAQARRQKIEKLKIATSLIAVGIGVALLIVYDKNP